MRRLLLLCCLGLCCVQAHADRLVFGSFSSQTNASNWAAKLRSVLAIEVAVAVVSKDDRQMYRVQSGELTDQRFSQVVRRAEAAGIAYWRNISSTAPAATGPRIQQTPTQPVQPRSEVLEQLNTEQSVTEQSVSERARLVPPSRPSSSSQAVAEFDWEVDLQTRLFADRGFAGQSRYEGSLAVSGEYYRRWSDGQQSITFKPFLRLDSADAERSAFDVRELFYSRVGADWDLHIGARRVFWGVTEFNHLVDIINQTDLVENIDTEDKLGQPMVQLSLVRNWGILDMFLLTGFRERTFPGRDGRLNLPFRIDQRASFSSGAEEQRVDGAIRWSHHLGPFELGLHYFSGTSRDPEFLPRLTPGGQIRLRPHYSVIDQFGVDAQAFYGDWAVKFEGLSRSGLGDRYSAFNIGFERTLVGLFGSRLDLGVVGEYMYDERGADAFNTLFERDIALGGRFQFNDFANSQALVGIIYDTQRDDVLFSVEASRELSDSWSLQFEGRVFNGGKTLRADNVDLILT